MTRFIGKALIGLTFLLFTSCGIAYEFIFPVHTFKSKNITSYNIKKLALLPIIPDTKDSSGTFFSTNYFCDLLADEYPNLEIANIDDIRKHESDFIPDMIKDLKQFRILNKRGFLETDLGISLNDWKCDAVIVGCVDSTVYQSSWVMTETLPGVSKGRKTICYFSYFLVSMKDGKVLWKSSAKGSEIFLGKRVDKRGNQLIIYPPVDNAITNGLELVAEEFPKELLPKGYK